MKLATRAYDNSKRQAQAAERRRKILKCAAKVLADATNDEFRLEDVAQAAGVSVQTILRAFGSKDGLTVATLETEAPDAVDFSAFANIAADDIERCMLEMFKIYDKIGDLVIRLLADEHRSPQFQQALDVGRDFHKGLVTDLFGPRIEKKPVKERQILFHALLAATDIYVWKILRRDEALSLEDSVATVAFTLRSLIQEKN
ncbi:TetR/AcrR family transcriptional regulator [uncultured Roseobacter sp.]|uniref:TetR/AcrR family transcriptional regulator n=1 Tax=uncultured Roseobacter sp. TaxID=114847 RepID=UPI0026264D90|nr:TetR/AcrR family transcriptional regulator [uncultured Roseobacter sp.]